jgi:signal transduction histidine kinase/ligand-binding sensor domain-containing protein
MVMTLARAAVAAHDVDPLADYNVVTWTGADGLFSSNIFSIAQDPDRYLWLGTDEGIIRFDGVRFVPWNALSRTPLPERRVLSLLSSSDGSLWVGYGGAGGVSRIRKQEVTNYGERDGLPLDFVRALREDRSGAIWAVSPSGFYKYRGHAWEKVGPHAGVPDGPAWNAYEDAVGNFVIIAESGVFQRDAGAETFHTVKLTDLRIRDLSEGPSGIVTTDPVVGFRRLGQAVVRDDASHSPGRGFGTRVIADRRGNLWVGTQGQGLWRVRDWAEEGTPTIQAITTRDGLSGDEVRSILEDGDGNIWVGTTGGLQRFSPRHIRVVKDLGLVRAVAMAGDGGALAGTASGLFRISSSGARLNELLQASVFALHKDDKGIVWAGTDRGLIRIAMGRAATVPLPSGRALRQIVAITSDSHGALWLCDQDHGLFKWEDGRLTAYWPRVETNRRTAYSVFAGSNDRIWVALSGGMLGLIESNKPMELFGPTGDGSLRVVLESRNQVLWLGGDDGLSRFAGGRFVTASRANGLPGSSVSAVLEDREGYLWAGVGTGIIRINPNEFDELALHPSHQIQYTHYDGSDGLAGAPEWFATPSSVRGDDGRLWFVTVGGLAVLDPSTLESNRREYRAMISGVLADKQIVESIRTANLKPFTQTVQIEYTAVGLVSSAKARFRYRLQGFDRDWVEAGTRRQAIYTNLSPGTYSFEVVALTSDGTWNESGATWTFSIAPAFYQTRWFYAAAALMVLPLGWAGWRLRLRRVQRQFSLVLAERARLSRELHDTLLQSLVGVALQFEGLSHCVDASPASLKEHLLRMRSQVEDYIREARESISDLRSPMLERRNLEEALRDTSGRIMNGASVRFDFEVTGTPRRCRPSVEEEVLRIAREALYNAVRHSGASRIQLQLDYRRRSLHLRVSDDGVGFDGQGVEGHYGLANMRERARQIGARFRLVTLPNQGTRVETVVPIS